MQCARTWTRVGGVLLCVSALACQDDVTSWTVGENESVEIAGATGGASEVGGNTAGEADGELGRDAGGEDDGAPDVAESSANAAKDDGFGSRRDAGWRPSDAQIWKLMRVANKAEIDQANAARPKLSDPRIRAFADHMVEAHSAAQARQSALLQSLGIAPIASELSSNNEYEATGIVARFQNAAAEEIDRLYIDAQVTVHLKALDTLDDVLNPNAQEVSLQRELTHTRAEVEAHLDEAEALAEALASMR